MSEIAVISGTRRAMREMADGTIEVKIHIDPAHRKAFMENFGQIDMPVALAPLAADFERREAVVTRKDPEYGRHYAVLFKGGWFNNPKVVAAFGMSEIEPSEDRTDAMKQVIYGNFGVVSLTEIPPDAFIQFCQDAGIRSTIPAAFGAA